MKDSTILELQGVTKDFPGVRALDNVDFSLKKGEIHGLVGENGAGKSTLLKIIDGALKPTAGRMFYNGRSFFNSPRDAIDGGIATVHQEMNIIPFFNAVENIFLGKEISRFDFIQSRELEQRAHDLVKRLGITVHLDLHLEVRYLGAAERKIVEILRAINLEPRVLILDEPTASLTMDEVQALFSLLKKFKDMGMAIIFVSHHLEEVFEIADRITVLRNGRKVDTVPSRSLDKGDLIRMMIDRDLKSLFPKERVPIGKKILEIRDLCTGFLRNISLELKEGEIVGIAGMVGSGRTELLETIFGARKSNSGEILIEGRKVTIGAVGDAIRQGIFLVPEDRRSKGIIEAFTVKENLTLSHLSALCSFDFIDSGRENSLSESLVVKLNISTPSIHTSVKNLSGGNKQKVSFGKWSFGKARVFLFDEPTEGVDVGSKVEIYRLMHSLVSEGASILFVTSELPELVALSDRIYIMRDGMIVNCLSGETITQENVLKSTFGE
jgi:ABC-type sugar transport system ATPase subunit